MKEWRSLRKYVLSGLVGLLALVGCESSDPVDPDDPLAGGIVATFDVEGETFRVWTNNVIAITDILALQAGVGRATIPNAPLERGPGRGDHNAPYSWHMDGSRLEMAELTIEVCSAVPSYVEANVDEWVEVVGQYCPWSAVLLDVEDYR
jgi:hypothetical protein